MLNGIGLVRDYYFCVAIAGWDGVTADPSPFLLLFHKHRIIVGSWLQNWLFFLGCCFGGRCCFGSGDVLGRCFWGATENNQSFFLEGEIFSAVFSYIRMKKGKRLFKEDVYGQRRNCIANHSR